MNSRKMKVKSEIWWIVGISFIVFILTFFFSPILSYLAGTSQPTCAGGFGDQYGVLNTLFTGLAFVGLIATILLQRKDLELQRKELKRQSDEFETQNRLFDIQKFENLFFKYIEHVNYLRKDVFIEYDSENQAISDIFKNFRTCLQNIRMALRSPLEELIKYKEEYNERWIAFEKAYFDMIPWAIGFYGMMDYILKSDFLTEKEKNSYIKIVFSITPPQQLNILQIMGTISNREEQNEIEKILERKLFFHSSRNIFIEEKNIHLIKNGMGYGKHWFDAHLSIYAKKK